MKYKEAKAISSKFLAKGRGSAWSDGIPPWPAVAAHYIYEEFCDGSVNMFYRWIKDHMDNPPIWITHPELYDLIMESYTELSMKIRNENCGIGQTMECDNMHHCDGKCKSTIEERFLDDTGMNVPQSIVNGSYEKSYDDLIVDKDKLFIWKMSYVEE